MTAEGPDIRPLTRHVLAWFGQWRRADPDERERLRKRCLGGGFAETLERLEANVLAYRGQVVPDADGPLSVLLAGLSVPEPERVIHDLARAVYPDSGEWEQEQAAFEHLCRRLERHFPAPRPKPETGQSIHQAATQAAEAVRKTAVPSWVKGKRMNLKEPKLVAGEHSGKGLWASILAAMAKRELDPLTCSLPGDLLHEIGVEVGTTAGTVSATIYVNRGRYRREAEGGAGSNGAGSAADVRAEGPGETPPEPGSEDEPEPTDRSLELWVCRACKRENWAGLAACQECGAPRPLRTSEWRPARAEELEGMPPVPPLDTRKLILEHDQLTDEVGRLTERVTILTAANESLRSEIEPLRAQASAPPADREPAPVADLVPAGPDPVAASEGDRLTEEQRMAAFQLFGNCPGTIGERRRVLLLAANLATLAESR